MYLQEILEVGIGLVFVWLVISVGVMAVQEWIANQLGWRSRDLESAIGTMLASPLLTRSFYDHQIIRGLSKEPNWWNRFRFWVGNLFRKIAKKPARHELRPDYISASDFSHTVFSIIMKAGSEAWPVKKAFDDLRAFIDSLPQDRMNIEDRLEIKKFLDDSLEEARQVATVGIGADSIQNINDRITHFAEDHPEIKLEVNAILLQQINAYYDKLLEEQMAAPAKDFDKDPNLKRIRTGLLAVEQTSPRLNELVRGLMNDIEVYAVDQEKALAAARQNIESWFNHSMARLSGWYKRKTQVAAFIIGLFLAILLNVDSINMSVQLWREPTLRQTIVAQAQLAAQQGLPTPQPGTAQAANPVRTVSDLKNDLVGLNLPIGWETAAYTLKPGEACQVIPFSRTAVWGIPSAGGCKQVTNAPVDATGWLSKLAGILITALATMQGAPFWFDILKKIVNIRGTGPNPVEQKTGS